MARESIPGLVELGKRVKAVRNSLQLTQKKFAATLNLSGSFLSEIEAAKSKPGYEFFYNISKYCNVRISYLLHGEGDMFKADTQTQGLGDKEIGDPFETLDELMWYMEHSPLLRNTVMGFAAKFFYDNDRIIKRDSQRTTSPKK